MPDSEAKPSQSATTATRLPSEAVLTIKVSANPWRAIDADSGLSYVRWNTTIGSTVELPKDISTILGAAGKKYVDTLWVSITKRHEKLIKKYVAETEARDKLVPDDHSEHEVYQDRLDEIEMALYRHILQKHERKSELLESRVGVALDAVGYSWDEWRSRRATIRMQDHLERSETQTPVISREETSTGGHIVFTDSPPSDA